jgi:1-acyl-sn-glycerol-3-phosphate acyltransferase
VPRHGWMPTSPCGPGCTATPAPTVSAPRRVLRLACASTVLAGALCLAPLLGLATGAGRWRVVVAVFSGVLRALGVRLDVRGDPSFRERIPRGALVVTNHVSWLDVVVVSAVRPMRSLAKAEIRGWPLIGRLATRAGTLFLDRERLRSLPGTIGELTGVLRAGGTVGVYPEGTTWCGLASGAFRPAAFQAAIDGGVPVRPVALRYVLADGVTTTWPAFVGDETLIDSVRRVARLRELTVEAHVLDEIAPGTAANRRELAALAEARIASTLCRVGGEHRCGRRDRSESAQG